MEMKVKLLRAWQFFSKGHVIPDMPAAQAQMMVANGMAEYVKETARSPVRAVLTAGKGYITKNARG
jgi:hypothetical protein